MKTGRPKSGIATLGKMIARPKSGNATLGKMIARPKSGIATLCKMIARPKRWSAILGRGRLWFSPFLPTSLRGSRRSARVESFAGEMPASLVR